MTVTRNVLRTCEVKQAKIISNLLHGPSKGPQQVLLLIPLCTRAPIGVTLLNDPLKKLYFNQPENILCRITIVRGKNKIVSERKKVKVCVKNEVKCLKNASFWF